MENDLINLDFKNLIKIIWKKKILILISIILFSIFGIINSIFSPYQYTASTTLIPVKAGGGSTNISQLASLAGFDVMGGLGNQTSISPNLYPSIVNSTPFLDELSNFKIKIKDYDNRILLRDFLQNYSELNTIDIFKKDLLGQKTQNLNKINIKIKDEKLKFSNVKYSSFTNLDKSIYDLISDKISIVFTVREGTLRIQASMPDPISAAELAQKTTDLLQKKIIEFKVKKAKEELMFLEERYLETQKKFSEKKNDFAEFQDKNLNLISARSSIKFNQLESEYDLISEVFKQIAQQLEAQKLKVKKETPVFSVIEPVTVPLIRSSPVRINILKTWLFSGLIFGIILALSSQALLYIKLIYFKK